MESYLDEYIPGQIWLCLYPVKYAGLSFSSRMTVFRLSDGKVLLHSPCHINASLKQAIEEIGEVAYIAAPGSYHYLHVPSAQQAFPAAETYLCPGIEQKRPEMHFDWLLGDHAPSAWAGELEQVLVRGARFMWEVAFYHRAGKTLILVDLVENIGDETEGVGWGLKFWWKAVFHMWNNPKPAPEYQMGWKDKEAARESLERILAWDFERVIIAHGDLIEEDARAVVRKAWTRPLG